MKYKERAGAVQILQAGVERSEREGKHLVWVDVEDLGTVLSVLARETLARQQAERERGLAEEQASHDGCEADRLQARLAEAEKVLRDARDWPLGLSRFDLSRHIDDYFAGRLTGDHVQ